MYCVTKGFPKSELFGLSSQLQRAAVSVPSNIAEGQGRATPGEFRQFLGIARGSLAELHTQIIIASRLGYIRDDAFAMIEGLVEEVGRLLNGLLRSLKPR